MGSAVATGTGLFEHVKESKVWQEKNDAWVFFKKKPFFLSQQLSTLQTLPFIIALEKPFLILNLGMRSDNKRYMDKIHLETTTIFFLSHKEIEAFQWKNN